MRQVQYEPEKAMDLPELERARAKRTLTNMKEDRTPLTTLRRGFVAFQGERGGDGERLP